MKTYLINYNLINETAYSIQRIENTIRSFQYWAKPMERVWLIKTEDTRANIMQHLRTGTSSSLDKILVMEVTNEWISLNLSPNVVKWMKSGL